MQVGNRVKIKNIGSIFDNKTGIIESIDSENKRCVVFVDFIPEENKRIRQDFKLDDVEEIDTDYDASDDDISDL